MEIKDVHIYLFVEVFGEFIGFYFFIKLFFHLGNMVYRHAPWVLSTVAPFIGHQTAPKWQ